MSVKIWGPELWTEKTKNRVFLKALSNVKSYQKSDCFNPRSFLYKKYYRQIFCISTSSPWKLSQQIGTEIGSKTVFFPLDHKVLNGYCHHICLSVVVVCLSVCPWRVLGSHISQSRIFLKTCMKLGDFKVRKDWHFFYFPPEPGKYINRSSVS